MTTTKSAPPCDMGEMCLDCQPRIGNACPDNIPAAAIPLTVTSIDRRRFEVTRPDRRDTVIVRVPTPEEAGQIAAEEWGLKPGSYTINPTDWLADLGDKP